MKNSKPKSKPKQLKNLQDLFVSAVIVAKETDKLLAYVRELSEVLRTYYTNYEIIIVDNGIKEKQTDKLVTRLLELPCIRIIRLTQNFKHDTALFAGLEVSIGDFVCTLDPSLDPVATLPKLVAKNQSNDVVQGVSKVPVQGTVLSHLGRKAFYWYNKRYIGIDIPLHATYLASYSRRAVNSLVQSTRSQRHIRHLARRVGYAYEVVPYYPLQSPGSRKKLKSSFIEALEISISYSTHPLRFVTFLGLFAAVVNALYAVYVVVINIFRKNIAEGWTTTSLQLSVMFFVLFLVVVVISEYIGRILTESYKDPHYYITDELTSSVAIADSNKRNITK